MQDPILQDLIEKTAARLIELNIEFLRESDEANNIETGENRDSASDLENVYHTVESHVEDVYLEKLTTEVARQLGVYQN